MLLDLRNEGWGRRWDGAAGGFDVTQAMLYTDSAESLLLDTV